jgi:hypothetical protein
LSGLLDGLKYRQASTDPHSLDPRLRGRTYAIRFEDAWQASVALCAGGIRGWSTVRTNDQTGVIMALVQPGPFSKHVDIQIVIALDEYGQTRVDMSAVSRTERGDFGRSARLVDRFLLKLDEKLGAGPDTILDPARLDALLGELGARAAGQPSEGTTLPGPSPESVSR